MTRLLLRLVRLSVALSGLLLLAGCAAPALSPTPDLHVAQHASTRVHRLDFEPFDKQREPRTLLAAIRRSPQGLRAVLTTPTGQRLLTLVHDDRGARYTQHLMPGQPPLPAAWLAQRLEWSLWPLESLQRAFAGSDWQISETPNGRGRIRRIEHDHRLVARLDRWPGFDVLTDYQGRYRLTITPLKRDTDTEHAP